MLRSYLFFIAYWVICLVIGVPLAILSPFLKPQQIRRAIVFFCRSIIYALKTIAQIEIEFKGMENLPPAPFIIAAKHQSWGDGIAMVAKFGEVAFVIGAFVEQYPFTKAILKKAGAMVVDFERGHKRGRRVSKNFINHVAEGRNILIYPEGGMVPIDKKVLIKPGIYKFQAATNWPIVPVSTNLGLYWAGQSIKKEKGKAINYIHPPIYAGLGRKELLLKIENILNENSKQLFLDAIKQNPNLSQANLKWPNEVNHQTFYEV